MGSAPTQRAANRGIDERQVKLGCVQPGEAVATFGDAIRRLTDRATYLYVDDKRYWYSTVPTVTRLADDRASQLSRDDNGVAPATSPAGRTHHHQGPLKLACTARAMAPAPAPHRMSHYVSPYKPP
jgi:hypothetical protein